jgi:hypothetical protein
MTLGPLHAATRDLHHACEKHPVGAAMSSGKPPKQWYADWVAVLLAIHAYTDHLVPEAAQRAEQCLDDFNYMVYVEGIKPRCPPVVLDYVRNMKQDDLLAAAYVLTGAHLFGGEIMRKRLEGYPTQHLVWDDRKQVLAWFTPLRQREELAESARRCFAVLLAAMDTIQGADHGQDH